MLILIILYSKWNFYIFTLIIEIFKLLNFLNYDTENSHKKIAE